MLLNVSTPFATFSKWLNNLNSIDLVFVLDYTPRGYTFHYCTSIPAIVVSHSSVTYDISQYILIDSSNFFVKELRRVFILISIEIQIPYSAVHSNQY